MRFFRNDPSLIRWPTTIHEPMEMKGRGMILFDRWIEHYDLAIQSRPERERKAQRYRHIRPEKHLSNLYLYEEQEFDLLPADRAGFTEAVERYLSGRGRPLGTGAARQVSPYQAGSEIRFEAGNNGAEYTRQGWSDPESWGCWTNGFRAEMRIPLERPFEGPALLAVEADGLRQELASHAQRAGGLQPGAAGRLVHRNQGSRGADFADSGLRLGRQAGDPVGVPSGQSRLPGRFRRIRTRPETAGAGAAPAARERGGVRGHRQAPAGFCQAPKKVLWIKGISQ